MRLSGLCFRPGKRKRQYLWKWKKRLARATRWWWKHGHDRGFQYNSEAGLLVQRAQYFPSLTLYLLSYPYVLLPTWIVCNFMNIWATFCIFFLLYFSFTLNALSQLIKYQWAWKKARKENSSLRKLHCSHLPHLPLAWNLLQGIFVADSHFWLH